MTTLSEALTAATERTTRLGFPLADIYAGHVCLSEVYRIPEQDVNNLFPEGVPNHIVVHWAEHIAGNGRTYWWEFTLSCRSEQLPTGWEWPEQLLSPQEILRSAPARIIRNYIPPRNVPIDQEILRHLHLTW